MVLTDKGSQREEIEESSRAKGKGEIPLHASTSQRTLLTNEEDEISRSVTTSSDHRFREHLSGVFAQKIDWDSLMEMSKEWIRNPMNMALFAWITCIAVSGDLNDQPLVLEYLYLLQLQHLQLLAYTLL
ncbi:uncharacterized protein LOC121242717 [Juglans microcarpa x Juglans regia]|uniref:uncharacterized protein LOC121242717 n=1 Tax=Juglans microcarpa x Juglans regia TaxID=2249226 RepID=UPI001B7E2C71|nr:uncharacterized protein LOC121242717 [Juglans microcarpa x Juglans regia]